MSKIEKNDSLIVNEARRKILQSRREAGFPGRKKRTVCFFEARSRILWRRDRQNSLLKESRRFLWLRQGHASPVNGKRQYSVAKGGCRVLWFRQDAGFLSRREEQDSPACVFEAGAKAAAAALAEDDAEIVNAAGADAEAEAIAEAEAEAVLKLMLKLDLS